MYSRSLAVRLVVSLAVGALCSPLAAADTSLRRSTVETGTDLLNSLPECAVGPLRRYPRDTD